MEEVEKKSCCDCKFYDGICCMYKCAIKAIRYESEEAKNCKAYEKGIYNMIELEKSNYQ